MVLSMIGKVAKRIGQVFPLAIRDDALALCQKIGRILNVEEKMIKHCAHIVLHPVQGRAPIVPDHAPGLSVGAASHKGLLVEGCRVSASAQSRTILRVLLWCREARRLNGSLCAIEHQPTGSILRTSGTTAD